MALQVFLKIICFLKNIGTTYLVEGIYGLFARELAT